MTKEKEGKITLGTKDINFRQNTTENINYYVVLFGKL